MSENIGLIAAMPEEIRPLLKRLGPVRREKVGGFILHRFTCGRKKIALIESGIGVERAAKATQALIAAAAPEIILNVGFGGAVLPGPAVGDIVVADRLLFFKVRLFTEQRGMTPALTEQLAEALRAGLEGRCRVHRGTFVTTGEIVDKRTLARLLPTGRSNPVLEMESAAVARVAQERNIPCAAFRAISDGSDEELGFSIGDFTDREMRIRAWKVLWTVARKPRIIPQLVRLAKNSRRAGENLATAVRSVVDKL
jgi:adenosylhomocysteine nucleosidase